MKVVRPTRLLLVALFALLPFVLTGCFGWNSAPPPSSKVTVSGQVKVPNGTNAQSAGISSQALVSGGTTVAGATVRAYSFATGQAVSDVATTDANGRYTLSGIPANAGMIYIVVTKATSAGQLRLSTMVEVKPSGSGSSAGTSSAQVSADVNATTTLATAAWTPKLGTGVTVSTGDVAPSFSAADTYVQSHATLDLTVGSGIITSDGKLATTAPSELTQTLEQTVPSTINPDVSAAKSVMAQLRSMVTVSGVQDSKWAAFSPLFMDLAVLQADHELDHIGTRISLVANVRENVQYGYINPISGTVFRCTGDSYDSHFTATADTTSHGFAIIPCSDSGLSGQLDIDFTPGTTQSLTFTSTTDSALHYVTTWSGEATQPDAPNGMLSASFTDSDLLGPVSFSGTATTSGDTITLTNVKLDSPIIDISGSTVTQRNNQGTVGSWTVRKGSITGGVVHLTTADIDATITGGLDATWLADSAGVVRSVEDFALHGASLVDNKSSTTSSKNTWTFNSLTAHVANYTSIDFSSSSSQAALVIADVDASFKTVQDGTLNLKGHLDAGTAGVFKISGLNGGAQAVVTNGSGATVLKFNLTYDRNAPSASGSMVNGSGTKVADVKLNSGGAVPVPELDYTDGTIEFLA